MADEDKNKRPGYVFTAEEVERMRENQEGGNGRATGQKPDGYATGRTAGNPVAATESRQTQPGAGTNAGTAAETTVNMPELVVEAPRAVAGTTAAVQPVAGMEIPVGMPSGTGVTPAPIVDAGATFAPALAADTERLNRERFALEHPWVTSTDYGQAYKTYKELTPAQMMQDLAAWRGMQGKEIESWEWPLILAGRAPEESEQEIQRAARRGAWADRINAIGDVVNHFVNFGRAMGGNPIAQVQENYNPELSARLRAAEERLRRQRYQDYVDAMEKRYKAKEALEAEKRRYAHQKELQAARRNADLDEQRVETEKQNTRLRKWQARQARRKALGIPEEQQRAAEWHQQRIEESKSRIEANKRRNQGGGKKGNTPRPYIVTGPDGTVYEYTNIDQAYEHAMRLAGKEPKKRGKRTKDDYEEAGVKVR